MGYMHAEHVGKAGHYLLAGLNEEGAIRYSRFYGGSDDAAETLRRACGFENEMDAAECTMDVAVGQLEAAGVVKTTHLADKLADGEPDYQIELTPEGRRV